MGGSAHQTRNGSDLRELLVIASDLTGAFRLPPAFRRPKLRRRGYYAGPPKKELYIPKALTSLNLNDV